MWKVSLLLGLLSACDDAGPMLAPDRDPPRPCVVTPDNGPNCAVTPNACGNAHVDRCWSAPAMTSTFCPWVEEREACDPSASVEAACTSLGFLSGVAPCAADCSVPDTSTCVVCDGACATYPAMVFSEIAVSGSHIALVGGDRLEIFDGTALVGDVALATISSGVGVPQGFLVASGTPRTLTPVDLAGVPGTARPLPTSAENPVLAHGAGGRVLVAWTVPAMKTWDVHVVIADVDGTTLVPDRIVMRALTSPAIAATSNDASFFIGGAGELARVEPDGTSTTHAGFAAGSSARIETVWNGTTGWHVAIEATSMAVRPFDASGTPTASLTSQATGLDVLGNGSELLVLEVATPVADSTRRLQIRGGALFGADPYVEPARFARVGAELVAAWNVGTRLQLARIPAP